MNSELLRDFWRYVRLYLLVSVARFCLNYVYGYFRIPSTLEALWPQPTLLMQILWSLWLNPLEVIWSAFTEGQVLLVVIQFWIAAAFIFWLLTTVLPSVLSVILVKRALLISGVGGQKPKVRQHSAWTVVITMTICLFVTFNVIGRVLAHLTWSTSHELAIIFRTYPNVVAGLLSLLGIAYALLKSRGASSVVGRRMGVTTLPGDDPLTQRVHHFADRLNLPHPIVGTMNAMNAFAIGTKPGDAAVVIGKPLLENLSEEEVDAIIGHELGHIASNDMRRMLLAEGYQAVIGGLLGNIMRFFATALPRSESGARLAQSLYVLGRFSLAGASELIVKRISRTREYVADKTGAMLTSPEVMISALEKVCSSPAKYTREENKYGYLMFRSAFQGNPFSTHPTLNQRKTSLLSFADEPKEQAGKAGLLAVSPPTAETQALTVKILAIGSMVALFVSALIAEAAHKDWLQAQSTREQAATERAQTERSRQNDLSRSGSAERELSAQRTQFEKEKAAAQAEFQRMQATERAQHEQRLRQMKQDAEIAIAAANARLDEQQPQYSPAPPAQPAPSPFPPPYQQQTFPAPLPPAPPPTIQRIPQPTVTLCDQLAANPTDVQRSGVPGVRFPDLKKRPFEAISACRQELDESPDEPRFKYQLARALYAANPKDPNSERLFGELVGQKYLAAFDNLGQIYRNRGNLATAVDLYRSGAAQGDPDSMIAVADLIREGKIQAKMPNEDNYLYDLAASFGHEYAKKDREKRRLQGQMVQSGATVIRNLLGFH